MDHLRALIKEAIVENDLEKWLDNASEKVRRNVEIVSPADVGQGFMMHLSSNPSIKEFIPMISSRQAGSEDRTVPRVCAATTLFGCIIGYAQALEEFRLMTPGQKHNDVLWHGGWYLYELNFEHALKPTKELVFDQDHSDEYWLVPYNARTSSYLASKMGKVFFRAITYKALNNVVPLSTVEVEAFVEVNHLDGFRFSKNVHLSKGFWRVEFPYRYHKENFWYKDKQVRAKQIEREDYLQVKSESASLLSFTEPRPAYLSW